MIDAQDLHSLCDRRVIDRILWLHRTDRWYFGDFLRHAPWLGWLRDAFPAASIDLASHPAYLPLYDDDRFAGLLDAATIEPHSMRCYDLVVAPSAYRPTNGDVDIPLLLTTWDTGWAVTVRGRPRLTGAKAELNYFRAAHPSAAVGQGTPRTATVTPTPIKLTPAEADNVTEALARAFPHDGPVVIYNPTASNPFTRSTHLPKEVDNTLTAEEHAFILRQLVAALPDHHFIVGSALKPNDMLNARMVKTVTDLSLSKRVLTITELDLPEVTTIRGFAALLAADRVCSVTGSATGTNTHLAALSGTCSLSIERAADAHMLTNWARLTDFQMGSFRWRNPSTSTAIHTLDWSDRTDRTLAQVADAFMCHHRLAHQDSPGHNTPFGDAEDLAHVTRFNDAWTRHPADAMRTAPTLMQYMTLPHRAHYGTFDDEAAFLSLKYGTQHHGLQTLIETLDMPNEQARNTTVHLFEDSNLHKLLTRLTTHDATNHMTPPRSAAVSVSARRPGSPSPANRTTLTSDVSRSR